MVSNSLITPPRFRECLKRMAFQGLAKEYEANRQGASALICTSLGKLHSKICNSNYVLLENRKDIAVSEKISESFLKVLTNAWDAEEKSTNAALSGVTSAIGGVASAMNDGLSSKMGISSQTDAYINAAATLLGQSSDIRSASQNATAEAGKVFENAFGEIIDEFNNGTEVSANKPLFSYDFTQILANKKLAIEQKDDIITFTQSVPFLTPLIKKYYTDIDNDELLAKDVIAIYKEFSALELKIFVQEAIGNVTDKNLVLNFKN